MNEKQRLNYLLVLAYFMLRLVKEIHVYLKFSHILSKDKNTTKRKVQRRYKS